MNLAVALALFGGIFVVIAIILAALTTSNNFRVELELKHVELWKRLGSPGFTRTGIFDRSNEHWIYLMKGQYREIGDPELTRIGDKARWAFAGLVVVWSLVSIGWIAMSFR